MGACFNTFSVSRQQRASSSNTNTHRRADRQTATINTSSIEVLRSISEIPEYFSYFADAAKEAYISMLEIIISYDRKINIRYAMIKRNYSKAK